MISIFPLTSLEFGATFCICKISICIRDLKKCVYVHVCICVTCICMCRVDMYIGVCTYVYVKARKLVTDVFSTFFTEAGTLIEPRVLPSRSFFCLFVCVSISIFCLFIY